MKSPVSAAETSLLVDQLRLDERVDVTALDRVCQRVAVSLTSAPIISTPPAPPRAPWLGASKGALASTLALGAALGAWGYSLVREPTERVVYRDRWVQPASPSPALATSVMSPPATFASEPAAGAATRAPMTPKASPPAAALPVAREAPAALTNDGLTAELRLLDEARAALGAGEAETALVALRLHAQRHAGGLLQQEREALMVKALVSAGRYAEARAAGQRFAEQHPSSAMRDAVNAALASIP